MADQKLTNADEGSQTAPTNPYREQEYDPQPGRWDLKSVAKGKEADKVDWVGGKDVVS